MAPKGKDIKTRLIHEKKRSEAKEKNSSVARQIQEPTYRRTRARNAQDLLIYTYYRSIKAEMRAISKAAHLDSATTYGEQRPSFVSVMLDEFGISAHSQFLDLGSGIGNVVLQAYLEKGCFSTGVELHAGRARAAQKWCSDIGDVLTKKPKGFDLRWLGDETKLRERVSLARGNILGHYDAMTRILTADLIFCSNLKFPESINSRLPHRVLGRMKKGAVLVILRRLSMGRTRADQTWLADIGVTEEKRVSGRDAVSWTATPVEYWVYRK